jgi:hypothetical protein
MRGSHPTSPSSCGCGLAASAAVHDLSGAVKSRAPACSSCWRCAALRKWTGACGFTSRNAMHRSSSCTTSAGISCQEAQRDRPGVLRAWCHRQRFTTSSVPCEGSYRRWLQAQCRRAWTACWAEWCSAHEASVAPLWSAHPPAHNQGTVTATSTRESTQRACVPRKRSGSLTVAKREEHVLSWRTPRPASVGAASP